MKLNSINGLEVLKEIRERHPRLPVILVTGYREEMMPTMEAALTINACACLYKPLEIEVLLQAFDPDPAPGAGPAWFVGGRTPYSPKKAR